MHMGFKYDSGQYSSDPENTSSLYYPDEICLSQGLWLTSRALQGFSEDSALRTLQT